MPTVDEKNGSMLSASPIPPGITPDDMDDMFNLNYMQTHVTDKSHYNYAHETAPITKPANFIQKRKTQNTPGGMYFSIQTQECTHKRGSIT